MQCAHLYTALWLAALLSMHGLPAMSLSNVPCIHFIEFLGLERVLSMSRLISPLAQEEEEARMATLSILYSRQRYVHWANSIWHVAPRCAHCITLSPLCIPELVETFCKEQHPNPPCFSFDRSVCSPEYGQCIFSKSEGRLNCWGKDGKQFKG